MEQHLSFGITVIAIETSVVNVNATTETRESLKGGARVLGTSLETCRKRVDTPVCPCLMIQAHGAIRLSPDQRYASNFLALEHHARPRSSIWRRTRTVPDIGLLVLAVGGSISVFVQGR